QAGAAAINIFEAGPLLRELRSLVTQSRPLRASDVRRANDATQDDNSSIFADGTRISQPNSDLDTLANDIENYLTTLSPLLADTAANRAQIVNQIDVNLDKAIGLLERLARFAMPSPGWGFGYAWRQTAFTDLLAQISALVTRWTDKESKFND